MILPTFHDISMHLLFLAPFTPLGFVGAVEDTDAGDPADAPGVDPREITTPLSKEAAQR